MKTYESQVCDAVLLQNRSTTKREDVTESIPPFWVARCFLSIASIAVSEGEHYLCIGVWDCSVAFYHADLPEDEPIHVIPPRGLYKPGHCWQLKRAMNGTRPASLAYGNFVTDTMVDADFKKVQLVAMTFVNFERKINVLVHGDDLLGLGSYESLMWLNEVLENKMRINCIGIIGPGRNQCSVIFLQRTISYSSTGVDRGFTWQGDDKHALKRSLKA